MQGVDADRLDTTADAAGGRFARWRGRRTARVITWAARVVGLLTVLSVIAPLVRRRLQPATWFGLPLQATLVGTVLVATLGVGLMMLATGLRRRKRRAWQLAVLVCLVLAVSHLIGRHSLVPTVVALLLFGGLLLTRREFTALPDPVGRLAAVRVVLQMLGAGFLVVLLLLSVRPSLIDGRPSSGERLGQAALSLVGVSGPLRFRAVWLDDLTAGLGLTFGVAAVVLGGYFLLRSAEPRPRLGEEEDAGVRALLAHHGRADSLGYFALRRDKSVVFSSTGKAAVAYRVVAGVALASGDPLGDLEAWPGAITDFLAACRRYGWVPAVLGCSEAGARVWAREGGLDALELGDEAVVDVATFSLQGRSMRTVRQAVSRIRRAGYETTVRRLRDVDADELTDLRALVETWRGGPSERGFLDGALARRGRRRRPGGRDRRRDRRGADPRTPAVRAVGRRRSLARPHGPRPRSTRQRAQRAAHRRPARRLPRSRRRPRVAELRGLPIGPRARRAHRRRARRTAVGPAPAHRLTVVADRDALPLQRPLRPRRGCRATSSSTPSATCPASPSPPSRPRATAAARPPSSACSGAELSLQPARGDPSGA